MALSTNLSQAYILKKTRNERSQVVALSDANQREIDAIEAERVQLENRYARIKKDLNDAIVAREVELDRTRFVNSRVNSGAVTCSRLSYRHAFRYTGNRSTSSKRLKGNGQSRRKRLAN